MPSKTSKNIKNWEPDLPHMAKQIAKMREAGNWNGPSLEEERQGLKAYIERKILLERQAGVHLIGGSLK